MSLGVFMYLNMVANVQWLEMQWYFFPPLYLYKQKMQELCFFFCKKANTLLIQQEYLQKQNVAGIM